MSSSSVQIAQEALNAAEKSLRDLVARAASAQTVLDNDPQKWSTTILQFEGHGFKRVDLQGLVTGWYAQIEDLKKQVADKKTAYNNALAAQSQSEAFQKNPGLLDTLKEQAKTQAAALAQGTTKYLIWGTVALVIIIGAIVIIRKKYAA